MCCRCNACFNVGGSHNKINARRHPYFVWDSNPWSQFSSGRRRFMPRRHGHCDRQQVAFEIENICIQVKQLYSKWDILLHKTVEAQKYRHADSSVYSNMAGPLHTGILNSCCSKFCWLYLYLYLGTLQENKTLFTSSWLLNSQGLLSCNSANNCRVLGPALRIHCYNKRKFILECRQMFMELFVRLFSSNWLFLK